MAEEFATLLGNAPGKRPKGSVKMEALWKAGSENGSFTVGQKELAKRRTPPRRTQRSSRLAISPNTHEGRLVCGNLMDPSYGRATFFAATEPALASSRCCCPANPMCLCPVDELVREKASELSRSLDDKLSCQRIAAQLEHLVRDSVCGQAHVYHWLLACAAACDARCEDCGQFRGVNVILRTVCRIASKQPLCLSVEAVPCLRLWWELSDGVGVAACVACAIKATLRGTLCAGDITCKRGHVAAAALGLAADVCCALGDAQPIVRAGVLELVTAKFARLVSCERDTRARVADMAIALFEVCVYSQEARLLLWLAGAPSLLRKEAESIEFHFHAEATAMPRPHVILDPSATAATTLSKGDWVDACDRSGRWFEAVVLAAPSDSEDTKSKATVEKTVVHFRGLPCSHDIAVDKGQIRPLHAKTSRWRENLVVGAYCEVLCDEVWKRARIESVNSAGNLSLDMGEGLKKVLSRLSENLRPWTRRVREAYPGLDGLSERCTEVAKDIVAQPHCDYRMGTVCRDEKSTYEYDLHAVVLATADDLRRASTAAVHSARGHADELIKAFAALLCKPGNRRDDVRSVPKPEWRRFRDTFVRAQACLASFRSFNIVLDHLRDCAALWLELARVRRVLGRVGDGFSSLGRFCGKQHLSAVDVPRLRDEVASLQQTVNRRRDMCGQLLTLDLKRGIRPPSYLALEDSALTDIAQPALDRRLAEAVAYDAQFQSTMAAVRRVASARFGVVVALYVLGRSLPAKKRCLWAKRYEPIEDEQNDKASFSALRRLFVQHQDDDDTDDDDLADDEADLDALVATTNMDLKHRNAQVLRLYDDRRRLGLVDTFIRSGSLPPLHQVPPDDLLSLLATMGTEMRELISDACAAKLEQLVNTMGRAVELATRLQRAILTNLAAARARAGIVVGDRVIWRPPRSNVGNNAVAHPALVMSVENAGRAANVSLLRIIIDARTTSSVVDDPTTVMNIDGTYTVPAADLTVVLDDDDALPSGDDDLVSVAALDRLQSRLVLYEARASRREMERLATNILAVRVCLGNATPSDQPWATASTPSVAWLRPDADADAVLACLVVLRTLNALADDALAARLCVFRTRHAQLVAIRARAGASLGGIDTANAYTVHSKLDATALARLDCEVKVWQADLDGRLKLFDDHVNMLLAHWAAEGALPCASTERDAHWRPTSRYNQPPHDAGPSLPDQNSVHPLDAEAYRRLYRRQDPQFSFLADQLPTFVVASASAVAQPVLNARFLESSRARCVWWCSTWRDLAECACCYERVPRSEFVDALPAAALAAQNAATNTSALDLNSTLLCDHARATCAQCFKEYIQVALKDASHVTEAGVACCNTADAGCKFAFSTEWLEACGLVNSNDAAKLARFIRAARLGNSPSKGWCPKGCDCVIDFVAPGAACLVCGVEVCPRCRQEAHGPGPCDATNSAADIALADKNQWQRCPECRVIVEKTMNCDHITCRCGAHFCYNCGSSGHYCPTTCVRQRRFNRLDATDNTPIYNDAQDSSADY